MLPSANNLVTGVHCIREEGLFGSGSGECRMVERAITRGMRVEELSASTRHFSILGDVLEHTSTVPMRTK